MASLKPLGWAYSGPEDPFRVGTQLGTTFSYPILLFTSENQPLVGV
jgi:hypothetical protein